MKMQSKFKYINGFTLIEMMLSMLIGLIVIAGVGYTFMGTSKNFVLQDALSRMQESARVAFDIIGKDANIVGFTGCPQTSGHDINLLNASGDWDKNLFGAPLVGYENTATGPAEASPAYPSGVNGNVLRGDALTLLYVDNSRETIITAANTASNKLTLSGNTFVTGDIAVATDASCNHIAIFQVTNSAGNDVFHNENGVAGACGVSGNMCYGLGTPCNLGNCPSGTTYAFPASSRLFHLNAHTYFIKNNGYGEPSLYRQKLSVNAGQPSNAPEELVEGVQDMQIVYGVDTDNDGGVDSYETADNVANWGNVLAIRVSLLMVSRSDNKGVLSASQTYTYNGAAVTAGDNLLRKVFSTTISVKNRLQ